MLKELLIGLTEFFTSLDSDFYVIGATARDIIISGIHARQSGRKAEDLDIAFAISDWDKYEEISGKLCNKQAFTKDSKQKQRFWYKKIYALDIVPFGGIAKADKHIYWPPDESVAIPVHGFMEMAKETFEISIDNAFTILVASLPGIFMLKLSSWKDRHTTHNRDAEDMALILSNYLSLNDERAAKNHYDIYNLTPFSTFIAGTILMARDINTMIHDDSSVRDRLGSILRDELHKTLDSPLINKMLETHQSLKYEGVYDALDSMIKELNH